MERQLSPELIKWLKNELDIAVSMAIERQLMLEGQAIRISTVDLRTSKTDGAEETGGKEV